MSSNAHPSDFSHGRLNHRTSVDSSTSQWTLSSLASSTLAQPRSILSYSGHDLETESVVESSNTHYDLLDESGGENQIPSSEYALCMFDFDSNDPDQISFKKNDILRILHKEPSGWWATLVGQRSGWIPKAFVEVISYEMVEALKNVEHDLRIYEYEAEALYNAAPISDLTLNGPFEDQDEFEQEDGFQVVATDLHIPRDFTTAVTPDTPRFNLPRDLDPLYSPFAEARVDEKRASDVLSLVGPKTPRIPIPPGVPAPEPSLRSHKGPPYPIRVGTSMPPLNKNKPTPPTPVPAVSNIPTSPLSKTSFFFPPTLLSHSRSLGSFSTTDVGRRHSEELVIHSMAPLKHTQTFVEFPGGVNEINDDIESTSTYDNQKLRNNTTWRPPKVLRITGDDDAQAFHNAQIAQVSQPWYLKPRYTVDEIKMEYDGSVKAGTLAALVEKLTVDPLKSELENEFRHIFLTTFSTFSSADRVLGLLIALYELETPEGLGHEQFMEWKEKRCRPAQARVLHVLKLWVNMYGLVEDDPQLIPRLREFLEAVRSPPAHATSANHIMSLLDRPRNSDANRPLFATSAPMRRIMRNRNDLLKIDPAELAKQLTLYEARLYVKIRPHECLAWGGSQQGEVAQYLRNFVSTSDKLAAWVKTSVLSNDALGKRADTIELWIKVADKCRALHNYSSMSAIVAALTSQVVSRLQLTWAHVNRTSHLEPLARLAEPTNNFSTYRQLFSSIDGPCLPYIGIFLSDMVKVKETAPNFINVPASGTRPELFLINFVKRRKMAEVAHTILRHQPQVRDQYKIAEVTQIMQYLETQLKVATSRDEGGFWTRSQEVQAAELAHADIRKGLEAAGF